MNQLSKFSWIWRLSTVGFAVYGLFLQLWPNKWHQLSYFTLLSNIFVLIMLVFLLFTMLKGDTKKLVSTSTLRIKAAVTMTVLLTFIVYNVLLAPVAEPKDFYHWKNYTLHYIVPIMFFIDWLVFDVRGVYKKNDPINWTFVPLLYMVISLIKGYIFNVPIPGQPNSPYPYFFLNVNKLGWMGLGKYVVAIFVAYMILGYGLYAIKMFRATKR